MALVTSTVSWSVNGVIYLTGLRGATDDTNSCWSLREWDLSHYLVLILFYTLFLFVITVHTKALSNKKMFLRNWKQRKRSPSFCHYGCVYSWHGWSCQCCAHCASEHLLWFGQALSCFSRWVLIWAKAVPFYRWNFSERTHLWVTSRQPSCFLG